MYTPGSVQESLAEVLVIMEMVGVSGICGGPTGKVVMVISTGSLVISGPVLPSLLTAVMLILAGAW